MPITRAQSRTSVQRGKSKPTSAVLGSGPATPKKRKAPEKKELYRKDRKQKLRAPSKRASIPHSGVARKKSAKEQANKINKLIAEYGDLPLTDVGIPSPNKPTPETILSHMLNALLSSAHISHHIARNALLNLMKEGYYDLKTLKASTWKERVALLDEAGYARYDFSTATELGKLATLMKNKYDSDVSRILPLGTDAESARKLLKERLKEIKGIGPLGIEIFISTVQAIWPSVCPFISSRDLWVAEQIGLGKDANAIYELLGGNPAQMAKLSVALTKIRLEKHIKEFLE